jgi:hypothetical protein
LGYERELIGESTRHSARSVMSALIGGIQSHRRLGRFFEQQLEGMLVEVTGSGEVLAAAVLNERGEPLMRAGQLDLLANGRGEVAPGDSWSDDGFRLVERFHIDPVDQGGQGWGPGGYGGSGLGGGRGLGRRQEYGDIPEPFGTGGTFYAILVLDRSRHDQLVRRSEWSFVFVSLAGALVLVSVAVAWRTSVRLVEAKGREKLLETETRHWRELSQAAAGLAHETRNPLGLIRGWTQRLAQNDADPATQQRHALAVIEECDRVTARINHFLAFARPCEPKPETMDAGSMVEQLRIILQPDLEAKRLRLDFEPERRTRCASWPTVNCCGRCCSICCKTPSSSRRKDRGYHRIENGTPGDIPSDRRRPRSGRGRGIEKRFSLRILRPGRWNRSGLGHCTSHRAGHGWTVHYAPRPGGGAVFSLGGIHGSEQTNHPGRGRRTEPTATAG